jgi:hypothetical protein
MIFSPWNFWGLGENHNRAEERRKFWNFSARRIHFLKAEIRGANFLHPL